MSDSELEEKIVMFPINQSIYLTWKYVIGVIKEKQIILKPVVMFFQLSSDIKRRWMSPTVSHCATFCLLCVLRCADCQLKGLAQ